MCAPSLAHWICLPGTSDTQKPIPGAPSPCILDTLQVCGAGAPALQGNHTQPLKCASETQPKNTHTKDRQIVQFCLLDLRHLWPQVTQFLITIRFNRFWFLNFLISNMAVRPLSEFKKVCCTDHFPLFLGCSAVTLACWVWGFYYQC